MADVLYIYHDYVSFSQMSGRCSCDQSKSPMARRLASKTTWYLSVASNGHTWQNMVRLEAFLPTVIKIRAKQQISFVTLCICRK